MILFFWFLVQSSNNGADFKHFWGGFLRLWLFINTKRIFISKAPLNLDSFNTLFVIVWAFHPIQVSTECRALHACLHSFLRRQVQIGHIVSEELGVTGSLIISYPHLGAAAEDDRSTSTLWPQLRWCSFLAGLFCFSMCVQWRDVPHKAPPQRGHSRLSAFCGSDR